MPIDANAADADASSYTREIDTSEHTIVHWTVNFGLNLVLIDDNNADNGDNDDDGGDVTEVLWGTVPLCLWRTLPRPLPVLASKLCRSEHDEEDNI